MPDMEDHNEFKETWKTLISDRYLFKELKSSPEGIKDVGAFIDQKYIFDEIKSLPEAIKVVGAFIDQKVESTLKNLDVFMQNASFSLD